MTEHLWAPREGAYGRTINGRKVGPMRPITKWVWAAESVSHAAWDHYGRTLGPNAESIGPLVAEWADEAPNSAEPVDPSKIKVGDEVDVRLRVLRIDSGFLHVELPQHFLGEGTTKWLGEKGVVRHIPAPRPIEIGSKVRCVNFHGLVFEVRGIEEGYVWLKGQNYRSVVRESEVFLADEVA